MHNFALGIPLFALGLFAALLRFLLLGLRPLVLLLAGFFLLLGLGLAVLFLCQSLPRCGLLCGLFFLLGGIGPRLRLRLSKSLLCGFLVVCGLSVRVLLLAHHVATVKKSCSKFGGAAFLLAL